MRSIHGPFTWALGVIQVCFDMVTTYFQFGVRETTIFEQISGYVSGAWRFWTEPTMTKTSSEETNWQLNVKQWKNDQETPGPNS